MTSLRTASAQESRSVGDVWDGRGFCEACLAWRVQPHFIFPRAVMSSFTTASSKAPSPHRPTAAVRRPCLSCQ
ncbi:hypothetical protein E2C01_097383 [Portunus trituberculatus]|uniref:Uncharacterized protein n=1 Tax=Portunus trituberculatus TaxID=210409 RepID=A0A5B7K9F1_PORTR|nr:hypothetical protein [Portunus trituberculatus]